MGADGGTIPRRDELVKTKKKPEKVDKNIENAAKWKLCAISQEPLRDPVVSCRLGKLYNRESVIEALLNRTIESNDNAKHIKTIKDVKTLNFTRNPAFESAKADKGDEYKDHNVSQYICPVVGLEMNGKYRFAFSWRCGCVVSEKALREIKSEHCHKCGEKWFSDDEVVINGTEEEMERSRLDLEKRRQQEALVKKAKKLAKQQSTDASSSGPEEDSKKKSLKRKSVEDKANSKKTKSVQDDPTCSKAYKSLFTSSEEGKSQPRAHWVTFNPQYF